MLLMRPRGAGIYTHHVTKFVSTLALNSELTELEPMYELGTIKVLLVPFCCSGVSSLVNSVADIYQRAAGFGVSGAHNNLSGCIIWAIPNREHTHRERSFLITPS